MVKKWKGSGETGTSGVKYQKPLILGMVVGLVSGPFIMSFLAFLYVAATDYGSLKGEDWPWAITSIMSAVFVSTPMHLLVGGVMGLLSQRLNRLFCVLIGGACGATTGYFTSPWVDVERFSHGESAYIVLLLLTAIAIAVIVKRIASSKIPIDWDMDLSGETRSKYLPDRPQE